MKQNRLVLSISFEHCQAWCTFRATVTDLWCFFLTPGPEPGCVIVAARGWRLWGTQRRRCLLSSWPQSSSCWVLLSVEGDGNETPCTNHSCMIDNITPAKYGNYSPKHLLLKSFIKQTFFGKSFSNDTVCFFSPFQSLFINIFMFQAIVCLTKQAIWSHHLQSCHCWNDILSLTFNGMGKKIIERFTSHFLHVSLQFEIVT